MKTILCHLSKCYWFLFVVPLMFGVILLSGNQADAYDSCISIEKQVSVDGVNFVDANSTETAPTATNGVEYRLIIRNCGPLDQNDLDLTNVKINDSSLGIIDATTGDLLMGEERIITSQDEGFENLYQPNICDGTAEIIENTAIVTANNSNCGVPVDASDIAIVLCGVSGGCRFTGGGVDTDGNWDHTLEYGEMFRNGEIDRATFGGQAGASTALPPQPSGEWTHNNQKGPSGRFTFHGGTASAPMGTEIDEIRCSDPGGCRPSGDPPSPAKQLDFDGIGTFKNIGKGTNAPMFEIPDPNVTAEGNGNKTFDGTFHWFEVNIDDLGEPGGDNKGEIGSTCPDQGFGEKGDEELADCDCPDFYRITIYDGVNAADVVWVDGSIDPASLDRVNVIYEFYGYIDGGNLQIHHLTGKDL